MPQPKLVKFKEVCPENPNILRTDPRCINNINKKFINFPTPTPPPPPPSPTPPGPTPPGPTPPGPTPPGPTPPFTPPVTPFVPVIIKKPPSVYERLPAGPRVLAEEYDDITYTGGSIEMENFRPPLPVRNYRNAEITGEMTRLDLANIKRMTPLEQVAQKIQKIIMDKTRDIPDPPPSPPDPRRITLQESDAKTRLEVAERKLEEANQKYAEADDDYYGEEAEDNPNPDMLRDLKEILKKAKIRALLAEDEVIRAADNLRKIIEEPPDAPPGPPGDEPIEEVLERLNLESINITDLTPELRETILEFTKDYMSKEFEEYMVESQKRLTSIIQRIKEISDTYRSNRFTEELAEELDSLNDIKTSIEDGMSFVRDKLQEIKRIQSLRDKTIRRIILEEGPGSLLPSGPAPADSPPAPPGDEPSQQAGPSEPPPEQPRLVPRPRVPEVVPPDVPFFGEVRPPYRFNTIDQIIDYINNPDTTMPNQKRAVLELLRMMDEQLPIRNELAQLRAEQVDARAEFDRAKEQLFNDYNNSRLYDRAQSAQRFLKSKEFQIQYLTDRLSNIINLEQYVNSRFTFLARLDEIRGAPGPIAPPEPPPGPPEQIPPIRTIGEPGSSRGITQDMLDEEAMFDQQMREFAPLTESYEQYVLRLANKYISKGRPKMSRRDMEKIVKEAKTKSVEEGMVRSILQEYNLIDMGFEESLSHIEDVGERQIVRRTKEMVRSGTQEFELANMGLVPEQLASGIEPFELETESLIPKEPLTGFERPPPRGRYEPIPSESVEELARGPVVTSRPGIPKISKIPKIPKIPKISVPEGVGVEGGQLATGLAGGLAAAAVLSKTGITDKLGKFKMPADAFIVGGTGTSTAEAFTYAAGRAGLGAATEISAAGLASGFAKGGALAVPLVVGNYYLEKSLSGAGMSHMAAGGAAGAVTGIAAGAMMGGPVGAGIMYAISVGIGLSEGAKRDKEQMEAKYQAKVARVDSKNFQKASFYRNKFVESLPKYNYNIQDALAAFPNKTGLQRERADYNDWMMSVTGTFSAPTNQNLTSPILTGDALKVQQLMTQQILHRIGTQQKLEDTPPQLTSAELRFLNDRTNNNALDIIDNQVKLSLAHNEYLIKQTNEARQTAIDAFNKEGKVLTELDENTQAFLENDHDFEQLYYSNVVDSSRKKVIDAWYNDQVKFEDLDETTKMFAFTGHDSSQFTQGIKKLYRITEQNALGLGISVSDYQKLQSAQGDNQRQLYESMAQVDKNDTNLDETVAEGAYEDSHQDINATDNNLHSQEVKQNIVENTQPQENHLFIHQNDLHNESVGHALGNMSNPSL